jgi:hypothetical protein
MICKINLDDGFKNSYNINECIIFAKKLEESGIDALVLSGGITSKTPFYLMRGGVPLWGMIRAEKQWQHKAAYAIFGKFIIRKYKFTENFPALARQVRQAEDAAGLSWRCGSAQELRGHAGGFDMVAIGRARSMTGFILKVKDNDHHVSLRPFEYLCSRDRPGRSAVRDEMIG